MTLAVNTDSSFLKRMPKNTIIFFSTSVSESSIAPVKQEKWALSIPALLMVGSKTRHKLFIFLRSLDVRIIHNPIGIFWSFVHCGDN
jgi:hypothetical protein